MFEGIGKMFFPSLISAELLEKIERHEKKMAAFDRLIEHSKKTCTLPDITLIYALFKD